MIALVHWLCMGRSPDQVVMGMGSACARHGAACSMAPRGLPQALMQVLGPPHGRKSNQAGLFDQGERGMDLSTHWDEHLLTLLTLFTLR